MLTEKNIITLKLFKGVGKKTIEILNNQKNTFLNSPNDYITSLQDLKSSNSRLRIPTSNDILNAIDKCEEIIDTCLKSNIHIISKDSNFYPKILKEIKDAPIILFAKGLVNEMHYKNSVAIIGTREPSSYGYKVGERIGEIFAENGFTVVSGLAKGCDTAGHVGCLKGKGKTIAVLASGVNHIYPQENKELAKQIEENGILLSEYLPSEIPRNHYFVERDRIQSGLSDLVIIVETDVKGGTMHTANFALEQSRKVACLLTHKNKSINTVKGNIMLVNQGKATGIYNINDLQDLLNNM